MKLAGEEVRGKGKNLPKYAELLQHDWLTLLMQFWL
jgi:hypothetical protein